MKRYYTICIFVVFAVILTVTGCAAAKAGTGAKEQAGLTAAPDIMTLGQTAAYLNLSEDEVKSIIIVEKNKLDSTGSFSGMMFPYFKVNDKLYFYRASLDKWLMEITEARREYDLQKGIIYP